MSVQEVSQTNIFHDATQTTMTQTSTLQQNLQVNNQMNTQVTNVFTDEVQQRLTMQVTAAAAASVAEAQMQAQLHIHAADNAVQQHQAHIAQLTQAAQQAQQQVQLLARERAELEFAATQRVQQLQHELATALASPQQQTQGSAKASATTHTNSAIHSPSNNQHSSFTPTCDSSSRCSHLCGQSNSTNTERA